MNSSSMTGKILYVEDDEINAFLMRRYLNRWEVDLASDAETGLLLADQELYKIVLLDINLGESKMSGVEAMKILRENPRYNNSIFVAVTAYAMPEDRERFMLDGFDEYFSKPVDYENLMAFIEKSLVD
jgi:two-component system cell cycle response regulator DivK